MGPGVAEINDGRDNQCPGFPGSGLIDELWGLARFVNASELCWEPQVGATSYEFLRLAGFAIALPDPLLAAVRSPLLASFGCAVMSLDGKKLFYQVWRAERSRQRWRASRIPRAPRSPRRGPGAAETWRAVGV